MKIIWNHSSTSKVDEQNTTSNISLPKPTGQWIEDSEFETETFFDTSEVTEPVPSRIHIPESTKGSVSGSFPFKRSIYMSKRRNQKLPMPQRDFPNQCTLVTERKSPKISMSLKPLYLTLIPKSSPVIDCGRHQSQANDRSTKCFDGNRRNWDA